MVSKCKETETLRIHIYNSRIIDFFQKVYNGKEHRAHIQDSYMEMDRTSPHGTLLIDVT